MALKEFEKNQNSNTIFKAHGSDTRRATTKNQSAMKLLKGWIEEEVSEEESQQRESHFNSFKKIIDDERPPGHKLYAQE